MDTDRLRAAIEEEHAGICRDQNTCDISKAFDEGLYLWSAHMLIGATECPLTEAAYVALEPMKEQLDAECAELLKCPHIRCAECNAVVWSDDDEVTCGNCLHVIKSVEEESEEAL